MSDISPLAGKPAPRTLLVNVPRLMTAYFTLVPDPAIAAQRVSFGTSGHRGSAFATAFNEAHVLAITQAICTWRRQASTDGPLFLGMDTHALSEAAFASAIEVLAANGVETMIDDAHGYTPTPVISHAILGHNKSRTTGLADGIVISPSHNPPDEGGFKYNPANGGPADTGITGWIETTANRLLGDGLKDVRRMPYARARKAACIHDHDYVTPYVASLGDVVDMAAIAAAGVRIGIDPLGGAAVRYWQPIIERYKLAATVVNEIVDPTFAFMTVDHDGKIRMDCSSPSAMTKLVALRGQYDIAFANDTDADRHGIVCPSEGLMKPNDFLVAAIDYLCRNRPAWTGGGAIGKTAVSSAMIDRITTKLGRKLYEVPVGFKWFSAGLIDGSLVFGGEESAGASFLRRDGTVWTTDKDGLIMGLLAAEITARTGMDPGKYHAKATSDLGTSHYSRTDAPASPEQRDRLAKFKPAEVKATSLGGEPVLTKLDHAPGNGEAIGGIKVTARDGWFAARPSGTEDVYKIYAESFRDEAHLKLIKDEAHTLIDHLFGRV
ncbi:phosphoglucomutase (alpha-D-glucose-1,6-bisphosphate-dependent) [Polymorphobacter megasporae]|uniref:phosphoglucomutase (alpha-D-glucose-1,6-bisphosphate-dependent) n=1 Tax=Glacieibacterium megasporae TaxID=2835787 RepID=UPI001C1E47CB|nr:phosphoglucomutase (alpha-D-glucose-1,6-bisphosphate-dependent) [Polymorphobacter megasporae]UAJ12797.1 phosphoglucomutase (alpha-D-glucose-1,6-bisphosphate-dependent) [Polymorphobacter megasporae]